MAKGNNNQEVNEMLDVYHRLTGLDIAVRNIIRANNGQIDAAKIGSDPFSPSMAKLPQLED